MPLSSRVAVPDGGKLAGMRMIVVSMPRVLEHVPERLPLAQQLDACRPTAGAASRPTVKVRAGRFGPRRRQIRRHRLRVAMDEVEDAVAARVEAGDEGGPGHRALRRDRRAERREAARGGQLREIRQPAAVDQVRVRLVVEAVEAEHDHGLPPARLPTAARQQQDRRCSGEAQRRARHAIAGVSTSRRQRAS